MVMREIWLPSYNLTLNNDTLDIIIYFICSKYTSILIIYIISKDEKFYRENKGKWDRECWREGNSQIEGRFLTSPEHVEIRVQGLRDDVRVLGSWLAETQRIRGTEICPGALSHRGATVAMMPWKHTDSPPSCLWSPEQAGNALAFTVGSIASPICKYRNLCIIPFT